MVMAMARAASFNVLLASNASPKQHPENRPGHFRVQLLDALDLKGEWEVGLTEIVYPRSFYNYVGNQTVAFMSHERAVKLPVVTNFHAHSKKYKHIELPNGHYSNAEELMHYIREKLPRKYYEVSYHPISKHSHWVVKGGLSTLVLRKPVSDMMGFWNKEEVLLTMGEYESPHPCKVDRGRQTLFIYLDCIEHSPVGHTSVPLLRAITIEKHHGDTVTREFQRIYYRKMNKTHVKSLEVYVCDDTGKKVDFHWGHMLLNLHFRPSLA